jgi:protein-glutamine gamma-glutamyltransferase
MEPIGSYIFFLASTPLRVNGPYNEVSISPGGSVSNDDPTRAIDVYEGEADATDPAPIVQNSVSHDYPPEIRANYLGLPPHLDPRIPSLAQTITGSVQSNYARAKAIENYLRQNLGYTLDLPGQEADPLAQFLFQRKRGHCEYFASSMAIMLRALGIPARVVNGFRGGEYNDLNRTYIIRGRDAHSWVEVFFPEYGWVTFDPTPSASAQSGSGATTRMGLYLDALHEMWREWIVNYDFTRQARLGAEISSGANHIEGSMHAWYMRKYRKTLRRVRNMAGALGPNNILLISFLALAIMFLPFAPRIWRAFRQARIRKNPQAAPGSSATLWYARMLKTMERQGIRKTPAQTPAEFVSTIGDPEMQKCVMVFTQYYERARFAGSAEDAVRLPELYHQLAARKT